MKLLAVSAMVTKSVFSPPHLSYILLPHSKLHARVLLWCTSTKVNPVCRDGAKDSSGRRPQRHRLGVQALTNTPCWLTRECRRILVIV
jgi:hypothetical protein